MTENELRDEITRLLKFNEELGTVNAGLRQELTKLRAPPAADAMERALAVCAAVYAIGKLPAKTTPDDTTEVLVCTRQELCNLLTRALTDYGDQRAREAIESDAWRQIARAVDERLEQAKREARAAAIEEAARAVATIKLHSNDFNKSEMGIFERGVKYAIRTIRAIADKSPEATSF